MKTRHRKNKSLVNEHSKSNPYSHHRSFSFNRHVHKNGVPPLGNFGYQENLISESITLPMSTEINRQQRMNKRSAVKQNSQNLQRQKKVIKMKEKQTIPRKNKQKNTINRDKNSNDKGQKSNKKGSKDYLKYKQSLQKGKGDLSGQRKLKNSQQKRSFNNEKQKNEKIKIEKLKLNTKKRFAQDQTTANWQDILSQYYNHLSTEQVNEIKQYKWIYFLGKIKNRKTIQVSESIDRNPKSAREGYDKNNSKKQQNHRLNQQQDSQSVLVSSRRYQQTDRDDGGSNQFYRYQIGDHIAYRYEIIQSINQGSFGEVVKVYDHKSKQHLALKIVKKSQQIIQQTFIQVAILTHIKEKDKSDVSGIVRIKDFTIFRNHICIVFELLEGNLYQLLQVNNYNGLSEEVIRIFAVQILNSLAFLHQEKIIHCDIKPQNIVMRSWGKSRVKLIDFGSSCFSGHQIFQYLQSRYYRAPEVMLRKPYSFQIDMWSFGCLLVQLKIGEPLFAGSNNVEQLMYVINSIGLPNAKDGEYSQQFFQSQQIREIITENYIEQYHYMSKNNVDIKNDEFFKNCKYVKNCMKTIQQRLQSSKGYCKQDSSFLKFIEKILTWQPKKRLKPQEALQDNWILKGLPTEIKELYTIFNSAQYKKKSKPKSKQSKSSKNKQSSKRSNDKNKAKQIPNEKRKEVQFNELKSKQYNSYPFNNKALAGLNPQK